MTLPRPSNGLSFPSFERPFLPAGIYGGREVHKVTPKDLTEQDLDLAIDSLKRLKIDLTDASRRHLLLLCREAGRTPARPRWLAWIERARPMQVSLASG